MQQAFDQFNKTYQYIRELDALYTYLKDTLKLPNDLSDLLRAEWVYSVSAFDKLIHELVRIGMLDAFQSRRPKTRKFSTFSISIDTYTNIASSTPTSIPPAEYWFEQEIVERHKHLSFQEPEKIADALSLIWDEDHKWQTLSVTMTMTDRDLRNKLKAIISRRNKIVHEADLDLQTGIRNSIDKTDADDVVSFIEKLSEEIFNAVR